VSRENLELINSKMANDYVLQRRNYEYFFFKIDAVEYEDLKSISLNLDIYSSVAKIVMNEYMRTNPYLIEEGLGQSITFLPESLEKGENVLAYKGQVDVTSITINTGSSSYSKSLVRHIDEDSPYANALEFLLKSKIEKPINSKFAGSCYCLYDYTNEAYRMPQWLWSDAPTVSVLINTIRSGKYTEYNIEMEMLARSICEVLLNTQILDQAEDSYGAYISRYRYYSNADYAFNCLLGPNDTSFVVKWAMLPMFEYTREPRYLESAKIALDWVEKIIRTMPFVPSHYYFENKIWADRAFVDTGFVVEGFQKYDEITWGYKYRELIEFAMKRYITQFRLDNGFYGQNYIPETGVDNNLFSRGQGWALEGLLACIRARVNVEEFLAEAKSLANNIVENQNEDGSWSWSMGNYEPNDITKEGTGICEKATGVLASMLIELYILDERSDERYLLSSKKAIQWCEDNMVLNVEEGYGGIASMSINSGITGLPFLNVATGYANAFYLLAKDTLEKL
jgi:Predicted unsaturated glucuronyl hydrolase involved in regulation of bacterial surface properties, and related proteins